MHSNEKAAGYIGRTHYESTPWFDLQTAAKAGSPNVIYVVLDDVGYSDLSCFGSEIRTPNFDRLANRGVRFTNFHTTTLCSASRACMLTGRNHHSVGMRYLSNVDMGWPNGRGEITKRAALLSEVLLDAGYSTFAVGKWHIAPTDQASAAGPFDQWPLGRGFNRFYGFMNGSTDQFHPELICDNHPIAPPCSPEDGYHLSKDLVDQAIDMLSNHISLLPDKPFFMNFAFGAGHWPHQAPPSFLEGYADSYDAGWDVIRQQRLQRQKAMGLIPEDTELPASNPGVVPWDALSSDERRVSIRLQQAYAGFLEYSDLQFGRLLEFLQTTGKLDNTLIVLMSDNGASVDCGPNGTTNVLRWFNQIEDDSARNLADLELIGTPRGYSNYPWGWSQVSNTPLKLYKSWVHGGGVRDPMIVHWPAQIKDGGSLRHQFVHAVDVMPTVLEACGVQAPENYKGVPQMPVHGTSFSYAFSQADAPTRKVTQYFEMYGHRSLWHKGWKAVTNHKTGQAFEQDEWELYHLDRDFSENKNLAKQFPDKLNEMVERWWAEAGKYDVLPLDDRREVLFKASPRPDSVRAGNFFTYLPGIAPVPAQAAPITPDVSHRIEVQLSLQAGDQGVLLSFGNSAGGYVLLIKAQRLIYAYNRCGDITRLASDTLVQPGVRSVAFNFQKTGTLQGIGTLEIDGVVVGECRFDQTLKRISLSPMLIGSGALPPVSNDYDHDFRFTGCIEKITFNLDPDREVPAPEGHID